MTESKCIRCSKPLSGNQKRFCSTKCNKAYFALRYYREKALRKSQEIKVVSRPDGTYGGRDGGIKLDTIRNREKKIFDAPVMDFKFDRNEIIKIYKDQIQQGDELDIRYMTFRVVAVRRNDSIIYLCRSKIRPRPSFNRMMSIQHGGGKAANTWWNRRYRGITKKSEPDVVKELDIRKQEEKEIKSIS
jgi:ribosomal protein L24E